MYPSFVLKALYRIFPGMATKSGCRSIRFLLISPAASPTVFLIPITTAERTPVFIKRLTSAITITGRQLLIGRKIRIQQVDRN